MTALPDWLRPGERPAASAVTAPSGTRLLRRTVAAIGGALASGVSETELSGGRRLREADPRAKLVAALGLIVVATFLHGLVPLAACLAVALASAATARVPGRRIAPVALVALASAVVMLPASLNVVSGGEPLLTLWRPAGGALGPWRMPESVAVTADGLVVVGRMVLRTASCAAIAALLTATTRPHQLLGALRSLGVPQAFVMVLAMTERYLAVLLQAARELHLARLARSVGAVGVRREEAWAGAGVGALFRRTRSLADEVTAAMVSRGFFGEVRLLRHGRMRAGDWLLVAAAAGVAAILLALDRGFS